MSSQITHFLKDNVQSAFVRFYPNRDAHNNDDKLLLKWMERILQSWHDLCIKNPSHEWGSNYFRSDDGSFNAKVIFAKNPDKLFDATTKEHPGIEIPDETEVTSIKVMLSVDNQAKCTGIWYVKIHAKRDWQTVEDDVLKQVDKKARQLNKCRHFNPQHANLPSIIWIEYPALIEITNDDMNHFSLRLSGKFSSDKQGRYKSVATVVLVNTRLNLNKWGRLVEQVRLFFIPNPKAIPPMYQEFPYVTWPWWEAVEKNGTPCRQVMGQQMYLGKPYSN